MRVSIDDGHRIGRAVRGAICYTGDLFDPNRSKYEPEDYYIRHRAPVEADAGVHILAIKDMAGHLPAAADPLLVKSAEGRRPVCRCTFHTHDTSGIAAASVLASGRRGRVDASMPRWDAMSGLTSQPNLNDAWSAALRFRRARPMASIAARLHAAVRLLGRCAPLLPAVRDADIRAGTADVYRHEMPGGQYTNLREQAQLARAWSNRWAEVSANIRRGQQAIRRHCQGNANVQGGRRHGAVHGRPTT